jgi:cytochrome c peroxidase
MRSVPCLPFTLVHAVLLAACNLPDDPPIASKGASGASSVVGSEDADGFTAAEVALLHQLSPLPALPPDPTNAYADNAAAAVLGQRLFFDKALSGPLLVGDDGTNGGLGRSGQTGRVACVSCHGSRATDDARSTSSAISLGTDWGTRNALSVVNSSFYRWANWGGRFDSQWSQPISVVENAREMNGTRLQIAHVLFDKYRTDYDAIFPVPLDPALASTARDAARFPPTGKPKSAPTDPDGPWEGMAPADQLVVNRIAANFGKALAAYVRLNVSRDAPFDKYVAGDRTAIDASAKHGLKVFLGKGCVACHSGPKFSDDGFHNIGVEQVGAHVPATDPGRAADIAPLLASEFNSAGTFSDDPRSSKLTGLTGLAAAPENLGQFRTKGLRGVGASAPYMHAGQLATLEAVVEHYSKGGSDHGNTGVKDALIKPLQLTSSEAADLIAFLSTLEGAPLPEALRADTSR